MHGQKLRVAELMDEFLPMMNFPAQMYYRVDGIAMKLEQYSKSQCLEN
jgi:hypothetical protein